MKLHQSLIGLFLLAVTTCVQAAPDNANSLDDLVNKVSAGNSREAAQSEAAGDLLLQAMSLLGVAYRFGGSSPSSGLDCSGFIQYIFKKSLKINMPRTAAEMARTGRAVSRDELAPGDLVFFNTRGFANSHVGLYMGNGKFIHSPRTGKSVEVVNMNSEYWSKRFTGGRRVNRNTYGAAEALLPARKTVEIKPAADTAQEKPAVKPKPTERSNSATATSSKPSRKAGADQKKPASGKSKSKSATAREEKPAKGSKSSRKASDEPVGKHAKKQSAKAEETSKSTKGKKSSSGKDDSQAAKKSSKKKHSN